MGSYVVQRVIMLLWGAGVTYAVTNLREVRVPNWFFVSSAVVALLVYEIMFRSRKWVRIYALPIYYIIALAIRMPIEDMLAKWIVGERLPPITYLGGWIEPIRWEVYARSVPDSPYLQSILIDVALVVALAYFLLRRADVTVAPSEVRRPATLSVPSGGYGGIEMDPTQSQTTRFLSASAVLLGKSFRSRVLNHVKGKYRAVAPELGLDLGLLVRVCKFMDSRETMFRLLFVSLGVVAALVGFGSVGAAIVIFVLGAWGIQGYKSYEEQHQFPQFFGKDRYDPDAVSNKFKADLDTELASGIPKDEQNIVVYTGFSPFVGAGIDLGGWSFAVDLSQPKEQMGKDEEPVSFDAYELYTAVEQAINSLGFEGAVVKDCLFVNGVDIRKDRAVLPYMFGRPVQQVPPEMLNQYMAGLDSRIRHYKWIRVYDWGNELVISHFLRCVLKGENLFVEISRFLLTPVDAQYRRIDAIASKTWRDKVGLFVGALITGPFAALSAWLALLGEISGFIGRSLGSEDRQQRREIKSTPLYDYGIAQSIRELASSLRFVHYFQLLDREMYVKILEREMLDTIIEFLDDHNIDTSEIRQRQTTIMNQGIIVQGGDVEAQSLAVGAGAQARLTQQAAPQE